MRGTVPIVCFFFSHGWEITITFVVTVILPPNGNAGQTQTVCGRSQRVHIRRAGAMGDFRVAPNLENTGWVLFCSVLVVLPLPLPKLRADGGRGARL